MSRKYAPIYVSIWQDRAFTSLTARAQRLYLLINAQPDITFCGVIVYNERRWSKWASDTTTGAIHDDLLELVHANFVAFDEDTDEVWVRSFVKHNKVVESPKVLVAAKKQLESIHSENVRAAVSVQLFGQSDDGNTKEQVDTLCDTPSDTHWLGLGSSNSLLSTEPEPETKPQSSTPTLSVVKDDEGLVQEVADELARRAMRREIQRGGQIHAVKPWLVRASANEIEKHGPRIRQLAEQPGRSASAIADIIESPNSSVRNVVAGPDAFDALDIDQQDAITLDALIPRWFALSALASLRRGEDPVAHVIAAHAAHGEIA